MLKLLMLCLFDGVPYKTYNVYGNRDITHCFSLLSLRKIIQLFLDTSCGKCCAKVRVDIFWRLWWSQREMVRVRHVPANRKRDFLLWLFLELLQGGWHDQFRKYPAHICVFTNSSSGKFEENVQTSGHVWKQLMKKTLGNWFSDNKPYVTFIACDIEMYNSYICH